MQVAQRPVCKNHFHRWHLHHRRRYSQSPANMLSANKKKATFPTRCRPPPSGLVATIAPPPDLGGTGRGRGGELHLLRHPRGGCATASMTTRKTTTSKVHPCLAVAGFSALAHRCHRTWLPYHRIHCPLTLPSPDPLPPRVTVAESTSSPHQRRRRRILPPPLSKSPWPWSDTPTPFPSPPDSLMRGDLRERRGEGLRNI